MPIAVWQQWRCRIELPIQFQPCPDCLDGRAPQRNAALLAALAVQMDASSAIIEHRLATLTPVISDTRAPEL